MASLNFSGEASAADRESSGGKVQDVSPPAGSPSTHVTLILLPRNTSAGEIAAAGLSPGLLSAGLGSVPAEQTYLDITQGNRVFDSLYDTRLPPLGRDCSAWNAVLSRAESAPADIVPGLLASTLRGAGVVVRVGGGASCTFSAPEPRTARARVSKKLSGTPHADDQATLDVRSGDLRPGFVPGRARLGGNDLLIALERPPPARNEALAVGIAGRWFRRQADLRQHPPRRLRALDRRRSDDPRFPRDRRTRRRCRAGRFRREGAVDPAAVESLGARMASDPGAAWAGHRVRATRLAGPARPGRGGQRVGRSPGRACASRASRSSICRWSCCWARRSSRASGWNSCWRSSVRPCWPRRRSRRWVATGRSALPRL